MKYAQKMTPKQALRFAWDATTYGIEYVWWTLWDLIIVPFWRYTWRMWAGLAVGVLLGLMFRFLYLGEDPGQAWDALMEVLPW